MKIENITIGDYDFTLTFYESEFSLEYQSKTDETIGDMVEIEYSKIYDYVREFALDGKLNKTADEMRTECIKAQIENEMCIGDWEMLESLGIDPVIEKIKEYIF